MTETLPTDDEDLDAVIDAVQRADRATAIARATAAWRRGAAHPVILMLAAEGLDDGGRGGDALGLLQRALAAAPEEPELLKRYGIALARQELLQDAVAAFDAALDLDPDDVQTLINAGAASFRFGQLKAAGGYYQRAAELAPGDAEPLAALAALAARRQDPAEARALALRALAIHPRNVSAEIALARAEVMDGDADLAASRLSGLLERPDLNDEQRVGALDLRAEILDGQDRPAEAFADYTARNAILERAYGGPTIRAPRERRVDQAQRLIAHFSTASAGPWRARPPSDAVGAETVRGHVFLMGFPRSGTTLLEKALAGHPDAVTLEEVDHLAAAGGRLMDGDAALRRLPGLSAARADDCRRTYWRAVRESVGDDLSGKVLIDKMPLHTPALPVIARLFPDARILFALRDPRDVVLSCFRRRFQMNASMYEFLTLAGTARYYDRVMTLAMIYRDLLPLDVHDVKHEAMVADFEGEMRQVLDFIGLSWAPSVGGFADRARGVNRTPSDAQVARGLNAEGVGQWRRYALQMAPVLDGLAPWADRFGYRSDASPAMADG